MTPSAELTLTHPQPQHLTATITGEIDLSNAATLEQQILTALPTNTALTINLTAVTYLDSHGMRLLQHLIDRHTTNEISLTIITTPDTAPHDILTLLHINPTILTTEPAQ